MTAVVLNAFSGVVDFFNPNARQLAICMNVPSPAPSAITLTVQWHVSSASGWVPAVPNLYAEAAVGALGAAQNRIDGTLTLVNPDSVDRSVTGLATAVYTLPNALIAPFAGAGTPPAPGSIHSDPLMTGMILRTNVHKPGFAFPGYTAGDWYDAMPSATGSIGVIVGSDTGPITATFVDAPPPPPVPPELVPAIVRHEITLRHSAFLAGE
jgi:hypothetical protein